MYQNHKNNNCEINQLNPVKSCPSSPVKSRPSIFKTLEEVKCQIEYDCFPKKRGLHGMSIDPLIDEICLIIAEVLVRPPASTMRVRGTEIETGIVQEVYRALTHEHVEMVYENFIVQTQIIYKKTAYLQTSLYNSIFELNAHYQNQVNNDWRK